MPPESRRVKVRRAATGAAPATTTQSAINTSGECYRISEITLVDTHLASHPAIMQAMDRDRIRVEMLGTHRSALLEAMRPTLEMERRAFVVMPGYVQSQTDEDMHYISIPQVVAAHGMTTGYADIVDASQFITPGATVGDVDLFMQRISAAVYARRALLMAARQDGAYPRTQVDIQAALFSTCEVVRSLYLDAVRRRERQDVRVIGG